MTRIEAYIALFGRSATSTSKERAQEALQVIGDQFDPTDDEEDELGTTSDGLNDFLSHKNAYLVSLPDCPVKNILSTIRTPARTRTGTGSGANPPFTPPSIPPAALRNPPLKETHPYVTDPSELLAGIQTSTPPQSNKSAPQAPTAGSQSPEDEVGKRRTQNHERSEDRRAPGQRSEEQRLPFQDPGHPPVRTQPPNQIIGLTEADIITPHMRKALQSRAWPPILKGVLKAVEEARNQDPIQRARGSAFLHTAGVRANQFAHNPALCQIGYLLTQLLTDVRNCLDLEEEEKFKKRYNI